MAAKIIARPKTPTRLMPLGRSREKLSMDPVEVFSRIRPITDPSVEISVRRIDEKTLQLTEPVSCKPSSISQEEPVLKMVQATFTHVFDQDSQQKEVFDRVAFDLCDDLIQGKNGLLFTYGITGSGKTYTMTGCPTDIGILPRCLDVVFNSVGNYQTGRFVFTPDKFNNFEVRPESAAAVERARNNLCSTSSSNRVQPTTPKPKRMMDADWEIGPRTTEMGKIFGVDEDNAFAVFVSYVEIYNNYIYDLLDAKLDPKMKPQSKGLREDFYRSMYVSGLTEVEVKDTDEAFEVLMRGQKLRRVAHTILNTESSRSHSVFNIRLVQAPLDETGTEVIQDNNKIHVSQLSLVDLAGSERSSRTGNVGDRMRETGQINTSLMCLRQCIEQLRENQKTGSDKMVPYRASRLTQLFKSYFDGEGKVRMVVCLNPSSSDYDENLHVLQFAELTQEVEIPRGVAVRYEADGLTPGRRRAAQIIQEVKEQFEQEIANISGGHGGQSSSTPILPRTMSGVMFFDPTPLVDFSKTVDEDTFYRYKMFFEIQLKRRQELTSAANAKSTAFEEALRKYVIEHESLKKLHSECHANIESTETQNRRLRYEMSQIRQQLAIAEGRLAKYDRDANYLKNQEEALKRREIEMAAKVRSKENKLRAVKEIFDRPATSTNQNGSDENINRGPFTGLKGNLRPPIPTVSVSLYPQLPAGTPRRAPSPPPKPSRRDIQTYNTRNHRRSQSSGNAPVDTLAANRTQQVSQYCPGRVRRVQLKSESTTSSSDVDANGGKRKSDNDSNEGAAKRGRGC